MGLLLCLFVAIIIVWWAWIGDNDYEITKKVIRRSIAGTVTVIFFYLGIVIVAYLISFDAYATARAQYDKICAQYGQAVTVYGDKAVLDVRKAGDSWTDFRYQGYQQNMAAMITDLREVVSRYNTTIIKKRTWARNFFVGWYVVLPDTDMKTIDIINTLPAQK